jgi:MoaA/NifB/PqqE/SkfB family radical SAM enzyme
MESVTMTKKELENTKREKLRREKPLVYEKIIKLADKEKRGEPTCRIDIGYNYACNLSCQHCMANRFQKKERSLTVADMRNIAEQADAMGWCQFNISGGEPLILKNFDEVLAALMPDKFHIGISTNGYFLTHEKARHLKSIGLDKVMISLDSIDPDLHNKNRASNEAYEKAMSAIWNAKEAGLDTIIQHVVSHQNAQSENTVKIARFAQEYGFSLDLVIAKAIGQWEGRHEVLIDKDDAAFLRRLNEQYPAARRDVFPSYGMKGGCGALNKCFHITQYGDVLICVFMHISIGNVFEDSLETIVERGNKIKYVRNSSPLCLSGEDRNFINKYMSRFYGKPLPVDYREIFTAEDIIED